MVPCVACFVVRVFTVSSSMYLHDIYLGLRSCVATFWERAANSVNRMFSLYYGYLYFWLYTISVKNAVLWF